MPVRTTAPNVQTTFKSFPDPTAEQTSIINHTTGHTLVFAVAGSGKTTAMTMRIIHLIKAENVRPERILATTFTREAVAVILDRLARYPEAQGVTVCTLHSLAYRIVSEAQQQGLTTMHIGEKDAAIKLFGEARRQLAEEQPSKKTRLYALNYDDYMTYMSNQKANLALTYVPDDLPAWARKMIRPVDRSVDVYPDLYARYEELRRTAGLLDFDDTIIEAWMLMARYPSLLNAMQTRWDYVHVDEFQDVNHAQSEMLHLLTGQCLSYTAIGDDDQTVYQWRGAHPKFILAFTARYQATKFHLSTNFRSPMGIIGMANLVISKNSMREHKTMLASRPGNGVFIHADRPGGAAHIAIQAIQDGRRASEIMILVRMYAQTGEIEQSLLEAGIPYVIVGNVPFYQRSEVKILLAYLRLAMAELDAQRDITIDKERRSALLGDLKAVANLPNRFLSNKSLVTLAGGLWERGRTLVTALDDLSDDLWGNSKQAVRAWAGALGELTDDLGLASGKNALLGFADAIDYADHLIRTAPTREYGEERAGSIQALAEMAAHRSLGQLLNYITHLSSQARHVDRLAAVDHDEQERVVIMTPFRAKGLERPVIIMPGCNDSIYRVENSADSAAAEEERRVFYVALTRAQEEVHLLVNEDDPSRFLEDVNYERVVANHDALTELLERDPGDWGARETLQAAILLRIYGHEHFVQIWMDSQTRARLLQRFQSLKEKLLRELPSETIRTENTLSLERYAVHGELLLDDTDGALCAFPDIHALVEELSPRHAEQGIEPKASHPAPGSVVRPEQVRVGMPVWHPRFQAGKVVGMRGSGQNIEAEVQFAEQAATRKMVVAYANLRHRDAP